MTLTSFLEILKRRFWWFLVVLVVGIALGVATLVSATPSYAATSKLLATYTRSMLAADQFNAGELNSASAYLRSQINTYPELAKTDVILHRASIVLGSDGARILAESEVSVSSAKDSLVLEVRATSSNPERAARVANAVAGALADYVNGNGAGEGLAALQSVEQATPSMTPISPRPLFHMLITLIVSAMVALLVAFGRDELDTRAKAAADVTLATGLALLGSLPEDDDLRQSIAMMCDEAGIAAEEVRRLRSSLLVSIPEDASGAASGIVISSASPSEGKSTIALNLAAACAEDGHRVLLVEADLRRPSIASKLDLDGTVGLSHVLSGQVELEDAIQSYWCPELHLLLAGTCPANPSVLLGSPSMKRLLDYLRTSGKYDYIFIDTPPIDVSVESAQLADSVGNLVLVVARNRVRMQHIKGAIDSLEALSVAPLGFVFNGDTDKRRRYWTYGGYKYSYYHRISASKKSRRRHH